MFKSFAIALLAATATAGSDFATTPSDKRGSGDGSDNDNASYCSMIAEGTSAKTDLYTYFKYEGGNKEWHGETKLYLNDVLWTQSTTVDSLIEYGFCMQMTAAAGTVAPTYDCNSIQFLGIKLNDDKATAVPQYQNTTT